MGSIVLSMALRASFGVTFFCMYIPGFALICAAIGVPWEPAGLLINVSSVIHYALAIVVGFALFAGAFRHLILGRTAIVAMLIGILIQVPAVAFVWIDYEPEASEGIKILVRANRWAAIPVLAANVIVTFLELKTLTTGNDLGG